MSTDDIRGHEMAEADRRDRTEIALTAGMLREFLDGVDDDAPVSAELGIPGTGTTYSGGLVGFAVLRGGGAELHFDAAAHIPGSTHRH